MNTSRELRDHSSRRRRTIWTLLVVGLGIILTGGTAHALSYSWNVGSGDWFTPGNWNPSGPPGAGDDAVISNGGTCTLNSNTSINSLTLSSGTLTGTGTLDVNGTISWTGGNMTGTGVTNANGALSISGASGFVGIGQRTLNSNVSATWTGAFGIGWVGGAGTLNIAAGTIFDIQNNANIGAAGGSGTINNAGTFQKSAGAGTTSTDNTTFNNTGSVDVQVGTLLLSGGGTSTGAFDATGATLIFAGGTHNLSAAAAITGGNVTFSGATVNHAGSYSISGTTTVSNGAANFTGPGATLSGVVLSGPGTLNVSTSSASNAASFTQSAGALSGTGTLDVNGTISWTGGNMIGTGVTNANGALSISGASGFVGIGQRTLNSNVSATWTGAFGIGWVGGVGTLNIAVGTIFDVQNNANIGAAGGSGTINNAGTFQKSVGAGTTSTDNTTFNNSGTVDVQVGTLSLVGGSYTQTAGTTRLNGGSISKSGSSMAIQGGTLEGVGTLTGDVNNSGGTLSPGLSAGQLNETGAYTQGAGGAFTTQIGGLTVGTQYDRAAISGTATLAGTLNIALINAYEPNVGDTFTVMTFGSRSGDFTTVNGTSIGNGKIFQKNVSATNVVLEVVAEPTTTTSSSTTSTTSTSSTTSSSSSSTSTTSTSTSSSTTTSTIPGVGHLKCYKGKDARAKVTYKVDLLAGVGGFPNELGCTLKLGAKMMCVEVAKQNVNPAPPGGGPAIPPNAGSMFLSYKVTCPKQTLAAATLEDQFGAGLFTPLQPAGLLVPTLPGPANDHFTCYKAKDARPKVPYTADLIAGVAGFPDELGCTIKLGAKQICVQTTKQNVFPSPPGGGPGPGPASGTKFIAYKLKCPKLVSPVINATDQFGSGTYSPLTAKMLLVPAE